MRLFVGLLIFVAACDARSVSTNFQEWMPAIGLQRIMEGNEVLSTEVAIGEQNILLRVKWKKNKYFNYEIKWKGLTVGGDSDGEYHVSIETDTVTVHSEFNRRSLFDYKAKLNLGTITSEVHGDNEGFKKYDVVTTGNGYNLRVSGDTRRIEKIYEANVDIPLNLLNTSNSKHFSSGKIVAHFKANNLNNVALDGTIWIGPLGAQIDYDDRGKLLYTVHLNLEDIFEARARFNPLTQKLDIHVGLQFNIQNIVVRLMVNAFANGLTTYEAHLRGSSLNLFMKFDNYGGLIGEIKFVENGYGFKIHFDEHKKFDIGIIANDATGVIPLSNFP